MSLKQRTAQLAPISGELIGAARKLSGQGGGTVTALVAGDEALAKGLIALGADTAIAATNAGPRRRHRRRLPPGRRGSPRADGRRYRPPRPDEPRPRPWPGARLHARHRCRHGLRRTSRSMAASLRATRSRLRRQRPRRSTASRTPPQIVTVKAKSFDALGARCLAQRRRLVHRPMRGESRVKVLGVEQGRQHRRPHRGCPGGRLRWPRPRRPRRVHACSKSLADAAQGRHRRQPRRLRPRLVPAVASRSASPARRSRRTSTSPSPSPAPASTWPAWPARRTSSPSTRTPTRTW